LEIILFKKLESTQTYLIDNLKNKKLKTPIAIITKEQIDGKGSRDNKWIGQKGNFFASIAIDLENLEQLQIPPASYAIYFATIMAQTLWELDSKVWIKWPNDFYIDDKKIGGIITNRVDNAIVSGIGINLVSSPKEFSFCDIKIEAQKLLEKFIKNLEKNISWKQVFSIYKLQWQTNKKVFANVGQTKIDLSQAKLLDDGSLEYLGERIKNLR